MFEILRDVIRLVTFQPRPTEPRTPSRSTGA